MCGRRVEAGATYCEGHLCEIRACREPRMPPSTYCGNHKCMTPMCLRLRRTVNWGYQQGIGGFFCEMHACNHHGCQDRAEEESRYCGNHRKCRTRGCPRDVDPDGDDTAMCGRHQPRPQPRHQPRPEPRRQRRQEQVPPQYQPYYPQRPMMYPFQGWQQPWAFMGGQMR